MACVELYTKLVRNRLSSLNVGIDYRQFLQGLINSGQIQYVTSMICEYMDRFQVNLDQPFCLNPDDRQTDIQTEK